MKTKLHHKSCMLIAIERITRTIVLDQNSFFSTHVVWYLSVPWSITEPWRYLRISSSFLSGIRKVKQQRIARCFLPGWKCVMKTPIPPHPREDPSERGQNEAVPVKAEMKSLKAVLIRVPRIGISQKPWYIMMCDIFFLPVHTTFCSLGGGCKEKEERVEE